MGSWKCCLFLGKSRGEDGQLGHGDAEDRLIPIHVGALDGLEIVSVTCGADHTTAYSGTQMEVYSWGWSVLSLRFTLKNLLLKSQKKKCQISLS